ncbi:MAG: Rne/Rng family ribonuclease [Burkholderiaceae bacterium]
MKRMLFNATHAEELRVAIVDGQRLIDIDIESAGRESRKSNIYKGVVTRVEPSLEACFVNYGEERHGFLPFKEISRSYFKQGTEVSKARIQDAIREGQEVIVQVDKEERGAKGAALTTFISLAGRYLVLMPNNPRGGGVSRRVEGEDRQELRESLESLDYPNGMSLIARTAGIGRSVEELQWDLNYLLQLWTAVESAAGSAPGPFLIYQESSLVIRAIRDYFSPDIGEVLIDTDDIFEQARQFMAHVMPDMVSRVKRYRDPTPLFSRFQIEHQIETAYSRNVPLPSGGSIVIDHTEALVAIDVNSARATRGSDIEETALRTNLEAADEASRQMRLRDLGGLIVIDFIDMESSRNQREVEARLKEALHLDRARVQVGKISRFGLMELSRQRIRPALNEGTHITCPRCTGTGVIRDVESSALQILRVVQEESMKENTAAIYSQVPVEVATYLLNEKRGEIAKLEARMKVEIVLVPNKHLETPHYRLERLRHDDERLNSYRSSYSIADGPVEPQYLEAKVENNKPRQEAVVKGITPDRPAPVAPPRDESAELQTAAPMSPTAKTTDSVGLLGRIARWFRRDDAANEANASQQDTTVAPQRAQADGSETTGTPARGSRRGGRSGNEQRDRDRDRGRGSRRGGRGGSRQADEERAQAQPARTARETDGSDAAAKLGNEAADDSRRRRRRRKPNGADETVEVAANTAVAAEAVDDAPVTNDDAAAESDRPQAEARDGDDDSGARRRPRRRRGRRGAGRDQEADATQDEVVEAGSTETADAAQDSPEAEQTASVVDAESDEAAAEGAPRRSGRRRGRRGGRGAGAGASAAPETDAADAREQDAGLAADARAETVADDGEIYGDVAAPVAVASTAPIGSDADQTPVAEPVGEAPVAETIDAPVLPTDHDDSAAATVIAASGEMRTVDHEGAAAAIDAVVDANAQVAEARGADGGIAGNDTTTAESDVADGLASAGQAPQSANGDAAASNDARAQNDDVGAQPMDRDSLNAVVRDAGLQWVETRVDVGHAEPVAPAGPPPGRARRTRRAPAQGTPLQQVETRPEGPAA